MDTTCHFNAFCALFPILSYVVKQYSTALIEAHGTKLRLQFLQDCYAEQVLPESILPNRLMEMTDHPFEDFQRSILTKCIETKKLENKKAFDVLREKRQHFDNSIPPEWKEVLLDFCFQIMRKKVYQELKTKLNNKLNRLVEKSTWNTHANPSFTVNLSDKHLDKNTTCALGYGLSFSVSNKPIDSVHIARAFCQLEKHSNIPNEDINIIKGIVYANMMKPNIPNCPRRFTKALSDLKKDENIHITKADKANSIVILNKCDYLEKMNNLLGDETTYTQLQKNPTESVNGNFNKKIKELLGGNHALIKKLCVQSANLPYMYGQIKTHKPNNPARPIISSVGSITYNLSKYLVTLLNPLIGTISNSHIKNNVDLVEKLNNTNIGFDFKLVSFDVASLFTKVPIDDLLAFLPEELNKLDLPHSNDVIIELIKLCIKDCKFEFNSKYYAQKFGMAMGNPLSPVLSNLYMEFFESRILCNILPPNVIWYRYVDDIICIWPLEENVNNFLTNLNDLVPSIKFTMESENDSSLPFLDCMIHRVDKTFKFNIFRKATNVSAYVHYYSAQSNKVKQSVFSSMFLRALRICSPEFIDEEIDKIFTIGKQLKYPKSFLDITLKKAKKTFSAPIPKQPYNMKNLLVLPYNENFKGLPNILKNFNVNVAFKNNSTVRTTLIKNSPDNDIGSVYKVPCKACAKSYIGQTGKELNERLKQHKYSIKNGHENNALFLHLRDHNHQIDWNKAAPLVICKNSLDRNIIESSFIKHNKENIVNKSLGLYRLDSFIITEICKKYKFSR